MDNRFFLVSIYKGMFEMLYLPYSVPPKFGMNRATSTHPSSSNSASQPKITLPPIDDPSRKSVPKQPIVQPPSTLMQPNPFIPYVDFAKLDPDTKKQLLERFKRPPSS
jgi:hypothetical protein